MVTSPGGDVMGWWGSFWFFGMVFERNGLFGWVSGGWGLFVVYGVRIGLLGDLDGGMLV